MMIFGRRFAQIRHTVSITLLILSMSTAVACHEPGLERTSFEKWEVQELPYLGVRVEVPVDYYYGGGDTPNEAGFLMHPVYPPRGVIDEPRCILEVSFLRRSPEEIERDQASVARKKIDDEKREFWRWIYARHETIDSLDKGGQVIYRYDVACPDDSVLVIDGVTRRIGGEKAQEWMKEDDAAIRRILTSVECIGRKPWPTRKPE